MFDVAGKKMLIMGLGSSGYASACFLQERGAVVTVTDAAPEEKLQPLSRRLREKGIRLELGGHDLRTVAQVDAIVISPGVPETIPPIRAAREKGIPVWGEIELASWFVSRPMVAVTGTNGKTTVTRLISAMLEASGLSVFTGGNIGTPLIEYAGGDVKKDVVVIEVSSFQLDTIQTFHPHVSVLLNITDDHLDRYPDFSAYAESKARIFENQTQEDYAVLNGGDQYIRKLAAGSRATNLFFSRIPDTEDAARINGEAIYLPEFQTGGRQVLDLSLTTLTGRHNQENIAAASLAALAAGGNIDGIRSALRAFRGLPHRLEYIGTVDGVAYYDDSKATNVDAVLRALEAFDGDLILIMGGLDKGGSYDGLKEQIQGKVRLIILIGEAKSIIRDALARYTETAEAETMEEAVAVAHDRAKPGTTVLLSPACASFDMFDSYAHRGDVFCGAVNNLKERQQ